MVSSYKLDVLGNYGIDIKEVVTPVFVRHFRSYLSVVDSVDERVGGISYSSFRYKYSTIIHQGGARSSKTFSLIQFIIIILLTGDVSQVWIIGKSTVDLKKHFYVEFKKAMSLLGVSSFFKFNQNLAKISCIINSGELFFYGHRDEEQITGKQVEVVWVNEGDEIDNDELTKNLIMRTSRLLLIDWNPRKKNCWITDLMKLDSTCVINSNFTDNWSKQRYYDSDSGSIKYRNRYNISASIINNILSCRPTEANIKAGTSDPKRWAIYGRGEFYTSPERVYHDIKLCTFEKYISIKSVELFGLDFGVSSPCAMVGVKFCYDTNTYYVREIFYKSANDILADHNAKKSYNKSNIFDKRQERYFFKYLKELNNLDELIARKVVSDGSNNISDYFKYFRIIADNGGALGTVLCNKMIGEGYNIVYFKSAYATTKSLSLLHSIGIVSQCKIFVTQESRNFIKELDLYSWKKDRRGNVLDDEAPPRGQANHLMDAMRMAICWIRQNPTTYTENEGSMIVKHVNA